MVGFENALYPRVKVIEMEVVGQLPLFADDHSEVDGDQVQALHHAVSLIEAGLREKQHHESVQQLLVAYQLHAALLKLRAVVHYSVIVHLAEEGADQLAVAWEVLPHHSPMVGECGLGLIPELDVNTIEQVLIVSIEEHFGPLLIRIADLAQGSKDLFEFLLVFDLIEDMGLPIVDY